MENKNNIFEQLSYIQTHLNAPKSQRNSFGNYNYRSAEDILEALKPHLKATNTSLTVTDEIVFIEGHFYVKATARLWSTFGGEISASAYAREEESKKGYDCAQLTGATSSYARKYALNGLFAIDDNKDFDATNTGDDTPAPAPKKTTRTKKEEPPVQEIPVEVKPAETILAAITAAEKAKSEEELRAVWAANKDMYGNNPNFKLAISTNPHNPKKR